jgi:hypothetical protein
MEEAVRGVLVAGHMDLVENLELPDPDDRHVLAAAVKTGAQVIVTSNTKDFPQTALEQYGIEAQHPDVFVDHLADTTPGLVLSALQRISARLAKDPKTPLEILDTLESRGLVQTAVRIRPLL